MENRALFEAQDPQNMTNWASLDREQYDLQWQKDKQAQEAWNREHFTGWRGGVFLHEGQPYGKQKKG